MTDTFYKRLIIIISVLIPAVVTALAFVKIPAEGINLKFFPKFHATLNSITTLLLLAGLVFIKRKNIPLHKACMMSAIFFSVVFLMSYVFYHAISEPAKYGGEGFIRYVYFFILLTHIFLAAVVLPFVLITVYHALTRQFCRHKKIAKWTLPVWLYVTMTGVVVYVMMAKYY